MNPIYTAGYSGHTPDELKRAATKMNAIVVDIRVKPQSRIPGWSARELEDVLGFRYMCLPSLGNAALLDGGPMRLVDDESVTMVAAAADKGTLILLCGCRDFDACHRKLVSQKLAQRGIQTRELPWPVEERPVSIPCLSLHQPWATLIAIGAKTIETRGWATAYRGPLAIHAAKRVNKSEMIALDCTRSFHAALASIKPSPNASMWEYLPFGDIIAVVDLVDCRPTGSFTGEELDREQFQSPQFAPQGEYQWNRWTERDFGDFSLGRYGWVLENVRPLEKPASYRGAQGLFHVGTSLLEGVFDPR